MAHDRENRRPSPARAATASTLNRTACLLGGLTVAIVAFQVSFYPRPLVMPMASSLLALGAIAFASVALLRWQSLVARHFTFWDVAAMLLFLALAAGMASDPAAVEAYLGAVKESVAAQPAAIPATSNEMVPR